MNKLESNKQKKREALLNTAFELFTTKGINKTAISDIVEKAGVAKGTFYLYFSDKYDIRNKLISHKAGELFTQAINELDESDIEHNFTSELLFIINYIVDRLVSDKSLLNFISKNLSWGIFKKALNQPYESYETEDANFYNVYLESMKNSGLTCKDPEVLLFIIVELVGSTCYSSILYGEPLPIEEYKVHLNSTLTNIINSYVYPI